jgi:hypothetical protein
VKPPAEIAEFLAEVESLNGGRNAQIPEEARAITGLLNGIGIEPVALKGAAFLLEGVYPKPATLISPISIFSFRMLNWRLPRKLWSGTVIGPIRTMPWPASGITTPIAAASGSGQLPQRAGRTASLPGPRSIA